MLFDDQAWQRVPASVRSDIAVSFIQSILDDAIRAQRAGVFAKGATHITWLPGFFDELGWEEVKALMNETLARLIEVQRISSGRIAVKGEPGIPATVGLMGFETPP
jgi:hypothetical protein